MFGGYVKKHYICSAISGESPHSLRYRTTTFFNQLNYKPLKNKTIMKKILLTAIVAMFGMSAFAALPKAGDVGYLYNPASGKFIGTDAKLGTAGVKFTIVQEAKDTQTTPAGDYTDRAEELEGAVYLRFQTPSGLWCFLRNPMDFSGQGYKQFIVRETSKGLLLTHPYPNSTGPDWIEAKSYIQVVDGELTVAALDESNEGAYWQFVDEDTYKKIVGPTYPIALAGTVAGVTVEYTGTSSAEAPYSAKFTAASELLNIIKYESFDVSEFIGYGYKKIVVEFAEAAGSAWRFHSYGGRFDNIEELGGKTKHELKLSGNSIDDLTIFNWTGSTNQTLEITAMYFSKYEVGEDPEPEPEPTPAVFPEFGAQGFLYNPESGLIVNASATLVSKAEINKETDILTVWQKGTESYSATRVRIATGKTDDVWTSLRVKDGEEGAYTIGFINDGYSRMTLEAGPEEGSYYINNTYNTDGESTHPGYIKANVEDGSLTIATEKDEYCVWKFLTEEEFDALPTRISSVEKVAGTNAIFNVAGQQIKALQKGLNIVNGKKVYVK